MPNFSNLFNNLSDSQINIIVIIGAFLVLNIFTVGAIFKLTRQSRQSLILSIVFTVICMSICGWLIHQPIDQPVHQNHITVVQGTDSHHMLS